MRPFYPALVTAARDARTPLVMSRTSAPPPPMARDRAVLRRQVTMATAFATTAAMGFAALTSGCATDPGAGADGPPGLDGTEHAADQLPPRGHVALQEWLAAGHYQAWACEPSPHPARPPGAHGANRICSNAALSGSMSGEFPIGAASVKELHRSTGIAGYAVGIKIATGTAPTSWYWYEAVGSSVYADGPGVGLCAGCHRDAPRDSEFTRVP